jgi:predicted HTH transcriptional regulator
MIDLQELKQLVAQGEGSYIEFKKKAADPYKIMKEAVAFANSKGGWLFVGVADNGEIAGIKHPEGDHFTMKKALAEYAYPPISYQSQLLMLNAITGVVAIKIDEQLKKPVYHVQHPRDRKGKAYVRLADKSIQASREVLGVLRGTTRNRDTSFSYGPTEQLLLRHLEVHKTITLEQFMRITEMERKPASQLLVRLTLAGLLKIHPADNGDTFTRAPAGIL